MQKLKMLQKYKLTVESCVLNQTQFFLNILDKEF